MLRKIKNFLFRVKVYKVTVRGAEHIWYHVDAPNKFIAKWCGAALYNNEYMGFKTAKDMIVERFKYEEVQI